MADLTARPDHWTDSLPGNWQQAINTNGILNALGRALSRQAPDMTRGIEHDQYGSVSDRNWLLQQAAGGPPKMNPLAAEMLDKGGLLANFLGPGVKLPAAAPKPTGIRAYHGSPHDFNAERLVKFPDGRTEYIVGTPDRLPDIPFGAQVVKDFPLGRARLDKIGTGEGAQAYGPGFYGAESEGVAKSYRDNLSGGRTRGADNAPVYEIPRNVGERINAEGRPAVERRLAELDQLDKAESQVGVPNSAQASDPGASIRAALGGVNPVPSGMGPSATRMALRALERNALQEMMRTGDFKWSPPGRMYEVRINADPEQFLDWDKPLSQQPEAVRRLAQGLPDTATGEQIYRAIAERPRQGQRSGDPLNDVLFDIPITDHADAARRLREAGVPGTRYLDQGSRDVGSGTRNYAVWDDKLIEILRKYGLLPPVAAGTAAALNQQEPPL